MLKTLEEPPEFAHLVLLTDRPANVLPTIASRCQHVRFDALPPDELAGRLRGIDPATALACARLSLGDGERAEHLAYQPALRAAAEGYARGALRGERAWKPVLEQWKAAGEAAAAEVDERGADDVGPARRQHRARGDELFQIGHVIGQPANRARQPRKLQCQGQGKDRGRDQSSGQTDPLHTHQYG